MLEAIILMIFTAGLLTSVFVGLPTLYALLLGYLLFFLYALKKHHSVGTILRMSLKGVRTVKNVLLVFLLIGMITAVWRACGTIPVIVVYASQLIVPSLFVLITFLLCCFVSVLFGTSFGTAATIGVICMTVANSMEISPVITGGAVLSGIYFGDRCSPMSTSALLVSELTKTDLFHNIRRMLREQVIPFLITCLVYLLLGLKVGNHGPVFDIRALFSQQFQLHWIALLPALLILILSLLRVDVKLIMVVSIAVGSALCLLVQGMDGNTLLRTVVMGYHSTDPRLASMIDGGGIVSMLNVTAIVCISSTYTGIFEQTGLLCGLKHAIEAAGRKITPFGSALLTSVAAGMVACNQTLTVMLTHQLCNEMIPDPKEMADTLEHSALVVAPMIPWSIAAVVPISSIAAPYSCIFAACYLYLLPLWKLSSVLTARHSLPGLSSARSLPRENTR